MITARPRSFDGDDAVVELRGLTGTTLLLDIADAQRLAMEVISALSTTQESRAAAELDRARHALMLCVKALALMTPDAFDCCITPEQARARMVAIEAAHAVIAKGGR